MLIYMPADDSQSDPIRRTVDRTSTPYLRERYGIAANSRKKWLLPAALVLIIGGGWLIWSANFYSKPEIRTQVMSFTPAKHGAISIRYTIRIRTAARAHQCVLIARDYQAITVGQVTDTIPAGRNAYTRMVLIPARAPAASASIDHCSLAP